MCVRCGSPHICDPLGLCLSCSIDLRQEIHAGFERLNDYLAAWAAFEQWEAEQAVDVG
jgi:hypothetical protein